MLIAPTVVSSLILPPQPSLVSDYCYEPAKQRKHLRNTKNFNNHKQPDNLQLFSPNNASLSTNVSVTRDYSTFRENPEVPTAVVSDAPSVADLLDCNELVSRIQYCNSLREVKKIHAAVLKCLNGSVTFAHNNLISMYVRFGSLTAARNVFDAMPERNVVSWTAMMNGYSTFGLEDEALSLFIDFIEHGGPANSKTFVCVLNLCSKILDFELGKQVHACILKGNFNNLILDSAIVHFYAQLGDLSSAFLAFDLMQEHDVVSWTTMVSACSQNGYGDEAITMFSQMLSDGFAPNEFTICSVLKACGDENQAKFGRQLHAAIVKKRYKTDVFVWTSLVDMYAKCGEIRDSRAVFNRLRKRNTVTWTSIIAGYARNGNGEEGVSLFREMRRKKIISNSLTTVSVLRACGLIKALRAGKEIHAHVIKTCAPSNIYLGSTLVWFYCKCGEQSVASNVLNQMPCRDVVSWTAMISGCARLGHEHEALEFMKEMMGQGVEPNPFTYSSALKICAKIDDIRRGRLIHSSVHKAPPSRSNVFVGSALINMYARCGSIEDAIQVFDKMSDRNSVSWKAMILGYAKNGLCGEALKMIYRMEGEGVNVDDYVLALVLIKCGDFEWGLDGKPVLSS